MNVDLRVVIRQLALLLLVLAAWVLLVGVFAGADHLLTDRKDWSDCHALLLSAAISALVGLVLYFVGRPSMGNMRQREAMLLVALSWFLGAALAATPFALWSSFRPDAATTSHPFDSFVNCYFEAISGLTTTGATVVDHLATLPRSIHLWRAVTHWLGGLGIVVLFVAVLPMLGMGGRRMYRGEAPGLKKDGVTPRIQDTARILWMIYTGLTIVEIIALRIFGMTWFEATCHTFSTLATGGFSTLDSSVAGFPSTAIHVIFMIFMFLAGVNFAHYHRLLHGKWRDVLADPELRVYSGIILVATIIITISLQAGAPGTHDTSVGIDLRDATFQVLAMQTTTGFVTTDFDQWEFLPKVVLIALMFIGASAGSTGGGIKVIRILVAAKVLWNEIVHAYRPHVVRTVKVGKTTIDHDARMDTVVYLLGIGVLFAGGTVALVLLESSYGNGIDITTAATASAATLNNIGPGLARVGATHNYGWFTDASKLMMCGLMVLGRLEVFTIVVLFSPGFWKSE